MTTIEVLTPPEIADLLKVSVRSLQEKVMRSPGFPAPVIDVSPKTRRWTRASIDKWLIEQQRKAAR